MTIDLDEFKAKLKRAVYAAYPRGVLAFLQDDVPLLVREVEELRDKIEKDRVKVGIVYTLEDMVRDYETKLQHFDAMREALVGLIENESSDEWMHLNTNHQPIQEAVEILMQIGAIEHDPYQNLYRIVQKEPAQ